jgi:hypothetical protein
LITIKNSADININDGIKCLLYGAAGVGKTPTLATAPAPIILSAERGLLSIRRTRTAYIEIKDYRDLWEAYQWCAGSAEARQFYTIGLDSISEIAEVVLTEEKRKSKDPRKAYGEVIDNVVNLCRAFRDLPGRSVVLIAKEEYEKEETSGAMMFKPMMPGAKLGPKLPYYFDEVFRMICNPINRAQRALHTVASFQHVARDRSGMLAEYEEPNLTSVFRKILQI